MTLKRPPANGENDMLAPPRASDRELAEEEAIDTSGGGGMRMGGGGGGGGGGGMGSIIRTAIVSIIVCVLVFMGIGMMGGVTFVTKSDFTTNLSGVSSAIDKLQKDSNTSKSSINDALAGIPKTVSDSINSSKTEWDKKINSMQSQVDSNNKAVADLASKVNSGSAVSSTVTAKIDKLDGSYNDLNSKISTLQKQNDDLTAKLTAYDTRIKTLETKPIPTVTATPTPTPTSTSSTSSTSSGTMGTSTYIDLVASVTSTGYLGIGTGGFASFPGLIHYTPSILPITSVNGTFTQSTPVIDLAKAAPSGMQLVQINGLYSYCSITSTQQFTLNLTNNSGKQATNIQLTIVYVWMDSNGNQIALPANTSYNLSSMGNPQWTNQAPTDTSETIWATGTNNSLLSSIWNFSQGTGSSSYYSNLSVSIPTSSSAAIVLPRDNWYGVPIVKITGYTGT